MNKNRVIVGRPCRVCGVVPADGYQKSRADKSDWVCPACNQTNLSRWLKNKGDDNK